MTATATANYYMNGLCGIQWGVFTLGGGNGNGKTVVMEIVAEWVGYPFATATATATHLIALHFAVGITTDTPQCEHSRRKIKLPLPLTPPSVNEPLVSFVTGEAKYFMSNNTVSQEKR